MIGSDGVTVNGGCEIDPEELQRWSADSRAAGTSMEQAVVQPCEPGRLPPLGDVAPGRIPVVVSLSGGGFRATLMACGALRFLADARLLGDVRVVSSVSGGSITNGLFAVIYDELAEEGFTSEAVDRLLIAPLFTKITGSSFTRDLLLHGYQVLGPKSRTELLADRLDRRWFGGARLESLPSGCRFVFNAANLASGARFEFDQRQCGDYVIGRVPVAGTGIKLATAVAASAAVPGAFSMLGIGADVAAFPCRSRAGVELVDGGVYDNLGIDAIDDYSDAVIVGCNAGGIYQLGPTKGLPIVGPLSRSNSSLYKQSTAVRSRNLVERFRIHNAARRTNPPGPPPAYSRRGVVFGLGTGITPRGDWTTPGDDFAHDLARVKTSFAKFDRRIASRLVERGWWLCGVTLTKHHPDLAPIDPTWNPPRP